MNDYTKSKAKPVKAGTILIKENDHSQKMFILKSGRVRVYKDYLGRKITLATLGAGEIFGELSFFDAAPRSASVEVIKDSEIIVIDRDEAAHQIKQLPSWMASLLKTTFERFRKMDDQITLFQSLNDFQKRTKQTDVLRRSIYMELSRYNGMLEIVYDKLFRENLKEVKHDDLYKMLEEMLGQKYISLKTYFAKMMEYHIIEENFDHSEYIVTIKDDDLKRFDEYLKAEINSERFLILETPGYALIRSCIGHSSIVLDDTNGDKIAYLTPDALLKDRPELVPGLEELTKKGIFYKENGMLATNKELLHNHYVYQSIIKAFDLSIIKVDEI